MSYVATSGLTTWVSVQPVNEPVTLAEVKSRLQLDISAHDELLQTLIKQARNQLETFTGLSLASQTRVASYSSVAKSTRLPYGPVSSITTGGDLLTSTSPFPVFLADHTEPVQVTYISGFGSATGMLPLPSELKGCILKIIRDEFEVETGISLTPADSLPSDWKHVARRHRQFSVYA